MVRDWELSRIEDTSSYLLLPIRFTSLDKTVASFKGGRRSGNSGAVSNYMLLAYLFLHMQDVIKMVGLFSFFA